MLDIAHEPVPALSREVGKIRKVFLSNGRIDDSFDRDAEKRKCEEEDKQPEDKLEHG